MSRDNLVYLRHMLDAIGRIEEYTQGLDAEGFLLNRLVQAGVIRELEIIGEAAKNISTEFRDAHNNIPWKVMAGTRDKLIHHYFGVDVEQVWDTITKNLPPLKKNLEKLLREES